MLRGKDVFARWKTQKLSTKIISGIIAVLILYGAPLIVLAAAVALITRSSVASAFSTGWLYGLWGALCIAVTMWLLFEYRTLGSRRVKKVNKDLEDSHFMSQREIAQNEGFTVTKFSELANVNDGVLLVAERTKKDMNIVLCNPIHTLLIATTGTGKTTAYVEPFIEVLSHTATKPCMVITDPKGELYGRHAHSLKKNGYNVHIVDLTNTYKSTLWNPFNDVMRKTDEIKYEITQEKGRYVYCGKVFDTYVEAEQVKKERAIKLRDEVYIDLQDLIYTACPVEAAQDKSWQQGARDLLLGLALRMWEDYRDGYLPREKFNLYNLWWNLTEYARGECEVLKAYVDDIADENSRAQGMANTVLVSQDRTLSSFLGSVNQYLHWMADGGVAQLTSGNEIEFSDWDEQPNVLFIKIPDMKEGRRGLVTLMLSQLYKALDEKGTLNEELGETPDKRLKRRCYFLMDEFASMPAIPNFDNIVKIARSLGALMIPVLQDYAQLNKVYGEQVASTIKNNCNIKIFMGTNDEKTRNEIAEACGKQKIKQVSYNEEKNMSVSTSAQSVPLIYPSELEKLNDPPNGVIGNAVVTIAGNYPFRGKTTPFFKAKDIYAADETTEEDKNEFMFFDEVANRYDIAGVVNFIKADAQYSEELDEAQNFKEKVQGEAVENIMENIAVKMLVKKVAVEINKLKDKLSLDDFVKLAAADTKQKIIILDELAENATREDKILLAADIEKVRSLLIQCSDGDAVSEDYDFLSEVQK